MRRFCARPLLRLLFVQLRRPLTGRSLVRRLMHDQQHRLQHDQTTHAPAPNGAHQPQPESPPQPEPPTSQPGRLLVLVRHGQTTYNVESRLPGQIHSVPLTDEGRRQAQRAAVALSGLPLSAIVSSPLERARDTAEIMARGWALPVRTDPRLMDTDVGPWAGQQIAELKKRDPRWEQYVQHPNAPPMGVESFDAVQARAVAAVQDILADPTLGDYVVLVAHADVIKLIVAHYSGMAAECARFVVVANASISALAFPHDQPAHLLAVNWTALPGWLSPPARRAPAPQEEASPPASESSSPAVSASAPSAAVPPITAPERSAADSTGASAALRSGEQP